MKMQKYFLFFVLMASQNFLPSEEADLRISSPDIFEKVKNNLDLITKELKDLRGKTTETTTAAPTTAAPTTAAPTTAAPTTAAPTTAAPTTAAPTTAAPTTAAPTTAAPTTPAPTTAAPTTPANTTSEESTTTTTEVETTTNSTNSTILDYEDYEEDEDNDYSDEKINTEEEDLEKEIKNADTTSKTNTTKVTTTTFSKNSLDANLPPKNSIEISRTNKKWLSLRTVVKTFIKHKQTNNLPEDTTAEDIKKVVATTNEVLKSINLYELTQKDVNDTDVVKSQLKWANTFLDDHPDIRTELKEDEEFSNDVSAAEEAAVNKQEEAEDVEVLFGVGLGSPFFAIYISLIVASFLLIMAILVQLLMICNKKRAPSQVSEVPLQVIQDPEPQKEFGIRQRQLSQEEALVEELTVVSHQRIPRTPQTEVPYKPVVPRRVIPRQYSGSYQGESRIPAARESQQYRRNRNA